MLIFKNKVIYAKVEEISAEEGYLVLSISHDGQEKIVESIDFSGLNRNYELEELVDEATKFCELGEDDVSSPLFEQAAVGSVIPVKCDIIAIQDEDGQYTIYLDQVSLTDQFPSANYHLSVELSETPNNPILNESLLKQWTTIIRDSEYSVAFIVGYSNLLNLNAVNGPVEGYREYLLNSKDAASAFVLGLNASNAEFELVQRPEAEIITGISKPQTANTLSI